MTDEDLIRIYRGLKADAGVRLVNKGHVAALRRVFDEGFLEGHMASQEELSNDFEDEDEAVPALASGGFVGLPGSNVGYRLHPTTYTTTGWNTVTGF